MRFIGIILGLYWVYIGVHIYGSIGIMEKKMEFTIVYWGYIRIEKEMETAIMGYIPLHCHFKVLFVDSALRRSQKRGSYHNGDTHGT